MLGWCLDGYGGINEVDIPLSDIKGGVVYMGSVVRFMDSAMRRVGVPCVITYGDHRRVTKCILQNDVRATYSSRYTSAQKRIVDSLGDRVNVCMVAFLSYREWLRELLRSSHDVYMQIDHTHYHVLASCEVNVGKDGFCHWVVIKPCVLNAPSYYDDFA